MSIQKSWDCCIERTDEADNHLVELALAGGADAIITNNVRDVRRGELAFPHLQILTPAQFLKTI